uniref:Thioredoxin domain-containing protein n=1 Tax=viral metagenome TaxID=1070528 RepID=A0A6C0KU69_9ZZZZ
MDATLWIVIYSKFSQACNDLFSFIQKYKITTPFKLLEIDNKDIRRRILSDKRFSIKSVPCIISISSTGVASQYEGPKAFELLNAMKPEEEVHMPVLQLQDVNTRPSPVVQYNDPPQTKLENFSLQIETNAPPAQKDNTVTLIEDLIDEEDAHRPLPQKTVEGDSMLNKGDRSVSNAIKGEKVSVSSVLTQAQKSDLNPRNGPPQRLEMKDKEDSTKQTGAKVNISSIMSSARV